MILLLIPLAILRGVLGRMGGAEGYDTKYRDIGCSLTIAADWAIILGWYSHIWWVYLLIFGLHWAAFCTYWDKIFKKDNFWFSGFVVGLCIAPVLFIDSGLLWVILLRAVMLCIAWGVLNKWLPWNGVLVWRRDVVE